MSKFPFLMTHEHLEFRPNKKGPLFAAVPLRHTFESSTNDRDRHHHRRPLRPRRDVSLAAVLR